MSESRKAAGILFCTADSRVCLVRRGGGGDFAGHWSVPGGHIEDGETAEQAARREAREETGRNYKGELRQIYDDGKFTTFLASGVEAFDCVLNDESTGSAWCRIDDAPQPLHPGLHVPFRVASAGTELDIARLIAEGHLSSPQVYANMHLLAVRITGTGLAYRSSLGEHVWRDETLYLNPEFLARCAGLTVIMDHPPGVVLTSKEFKNRVIGSIMFAYIKGQEVWGIAKVYDEEAMAEIAEGEISTSPSVVFDETSGNTTLQTESGEPLLIEGKAFLLDHLAIVTKDCGSRGVWDKGGAPSGVELSNTEIATMADETNTNAKADAAAATDSKLDRLIAATTEIATRQVSMSARIDAMEKNMPAPPLQPIADKRKDSDEEKAGEDDTKGAKKDAKKDASESKPTEKKEGKEGEFKPDADGDEKDGDKDKEAKGDDDADKMAAKCDADAALFADHQAKADSVLAAFGKAASRPLQGESLASYRKRLLRGLKGYSDAYKDVDLAGIKDDKLLTIVERQIYADALTAAKNPTARGDALIEHRTVDRAGRTVSTFTGNPGAWLDAFKLPPMRATHIGIPDRR